MDRDNKAIVLEGLDILFNRRNYEKASAFWSPEYVQHSRFVPGGRDGLFGLARSLPAGARYEHGLILAEGAYVVVHGRYSGLGGPTMIAVDIFRLEGGVMVEHWDVLQAEANRGESAGGHPMFGDSFA